MGNFVKNNPEICNYFIKSEFIAFETPKSIFINLPNENKNIGWWLSKVFVYPSQKHDNQTAIGIKYKNINSIWIYDENLKRTVYKTMTGYELISIYDKNKKSSLLGMKNALFPNQNINGYKNYNTQVNNVEIDFDNKNGIVWD